MSLIGTAIGALVALLPPALLQPKKVRADKTNGYDAGLKDGRLEAKDRSNSASLMVSTMQFELERLRRSHARLVDHIETLEREFLIEQHISTHWKAEAERLAKHASAARERAEAQEQQALMTQRQGRQPLRPADGRQAMAYAQMSAQQLAQQADNLAWRNQQQLGQAQGLQGAFEGFCNCVPSRAQVWGANRGEG
jgi:hypothetical protein